jgi:tetratricopeptide (TPR) repeat protein
MKYPFSGLGRRIDELWDALFRGSLLRVTLFSGALLSLCIGGLLAGVWVLGGGRGLRVENGAEESGFYQLLREYDRRGGLAPEAQSRELDKLENKTEGVESWLSVLKRRRRLARLDPRMVPAWRESARRAAREYPYSEPIAAVAAAALIHNAAITKETEAALRNCLPLLADSRFDSLRVSLHVLLGDLKTPARAAAMLPPDLTGNRFAAAIWQLPPTAAETAAIGADLAIVQVLRGNAAAAAADIPAVITGYTARLEAPPPEFLRFAAEYYYDFGDMPRSAELFSLLDDDAALGRQADALWLAGYTDSARNIWALLAAPGGEDADTRAGANVRAMYNLAVTAKEPAEAAALLERLAALPAGAGDGGVVYGRIRYSRLFDAPRAVALLETGRTTGPLAALIDLEILKRRTELDSGGRLAAETWLLLGAYPADENLYQWGAWFFDLRRNYDESAMLLKNAARHQFTGQWVALHEALRLIREGDVDSAGELLAAIPTEAASWPVAANVGRIQEARHDPARALLSYETAAAAVPNRETASRIQLRIAHCLTSLGRLSESRRSLEYALDLNPGNLSARLELHRLE